MPNSPMWRIVSAVLLLCSTVPAQTTYGIPGRSGDLLVKWGAFDPLTETPVLPEALLWSPGPEGEPDYFIVQFKQRVTEADRVLLEVVGAERLDYVPRNAYLVRLAPEKVPEVAGWPRVRAVEPLHPAWRIDPDEYSSGGAGLYSLRVFPGADGVAARRELVAAGAGIVLEEGTSRWRVEVPSGGLDAVLQIRDVCWVQVSREHVLRRNDTVTWTIQTNVQDNPSVWNHGLHGEGQIVGHIDAPLDLNHCYFNDPNVPTAGPTHRKVIVHNGSTGSNDGHGLHTASTMAGDREPIDGSTNRNGIAYKAKIAHSNENSLTDFNTDLKIQALIDEGALMFSHSWGYEDTTKYDWVARDVDLVSYLNEDTLQVWSTSNLQNIKNPENAKNCLAVGATQKQNPDNYCLGGKGPTDDGRRKPEVYTPGCGVQSAKINTACDTKADSGTSMAAPSLGGAAALVSQYFQEGWYPSGVKSAPDGFQPTGPLIKAVLINASVDMTGSGGVNGYPTDREGWGHLVLDNSLHFAGDPESIAVSDIRMADGIATIGEVRKWRFEVLSASLPVEITLAFHDAPGALMTNYAPVNDLDLVVTDPAGTVYVGNDFSGGQSTTGGLPDPRNNVERVRRDSPVPGIWEIQVIGVDLPAPAQGFALVASGDLTTHAAAVAYGSALAGTGGIAPMLAAGATPLLGRTVPFEVTGGVGGGPGLMVFSTVVGSIPALGGTLLVSSADIILPVALDGLPGSGGAGSDTVSVPVPDHPSLWGAHIYIQTLLADAGAPQGVSMTNGLDVSLGW